jgi:predicted metal-dependent hydrolase
MRVALLRRSAPDPTHLDVTFAGRAFRIAVRRRAAARRITLRVSSATGEVVLTLPEKADLRTAQRFADAHGGWIATRLARVPERVVFDAGSIVPLRGQPHRILHWSTVPSATVATRDADGACVIAVACDGAHVARRVRDFLEREARRDLVAAVQQHARTLGRAPKRITVRDTRTRWGSCSAKGLLNFSWRLILAPPYVLDYLAAHEVAHLKEMNHSERFWRVTHGLCPRTAEAERWLKRQGADLHRYG